VLFVKFVLSHALGAIVASAEQKAAYSRMHTCLKSGWRLLQPEDWLMTEARRNSTQLNSTQLNGSKLLVGENVQK
jgi:hypothetical protein